MKQRSRLDLLMIAINRWLEQPRTSRSTITAEIVQSADDCGLTEVLEKEGITFNKTDDPYNDMRVNAQKLFRWLGQYEGQHAFADRIFHIEQAILAAMPQDLKLSYLNDVYNLSGVLVCARQNNDLKLDVGRLVASLTKEQSEAQISILEFGSNRDLETAKKAIREVSEAVAIGTAALCELESRLSDLRQIKKRACSSIGKST